MDRHHRRLIEAFQAECRVAATQGVRLEVSANGKEGELSVYHIFAVEAGEAEVAP